MTVTGAPNTITELVEKFATAPPDRLDASYHDLVRAAWDDGELTLLAQPVADEIVSRLDRVDDLRKAYLAELAGLLVQAEVPDTDGPVSTVLRTKIDRFVVLWRESSREQPLYWALLYLLSHFPGDRDRVLAAARDIGVDHDDESRLERALADLDPKAPVLGRVFPYPAAYDEMSSSERDFDNNWVRTLSPTQVLSQWHNDIETVRGHAGAKAFYAIRHGAPASVIPDDRPPRVADPADADDAALYAPHLTALRCPRCQGTLTVHQGAAKCSCGMSFPITKGIMNLLDGTGGSGDLLSQLATISTMSYFYEVYARPAFRRLCGMNWENQVDHQWEQAYIAEHVRPVDGPVLDLAAGSGMWTNTLAETVGAERVLALDIAPGPLASLRDRRPDVAAVVASAGNLPFDDATLGAVLCWDALQAFPDVAADAIAEVGRCLRPGGSFTLYTFDNAEDEIYRHFVRAHRFPNHKDGLTLFERADLEAWLAGAGLKVVDSQGPAQQYIITAEKQA
nr:class I SAM-dependent methyltransferase [Kibdelosporangium sp. MJ126-NF4]CEL14222.1 methyltransferase [Kibdelosporangium sp. MJ126-NF4]CTQ88590.1 methyltransferase [Kibdelosporangium sp. MJ126-NF4]